MSSETTPSTDGGTTTETTVGYIVERLWTDTGEWMLWTEDHPTEREAETGRAMWAAEYGHDDRFRVARRTRTDVIEVL